MSELAANAALHSSASFMHVGLRAYDGAVRVSVEDDGAVPAQAVVPRPGFLTSLLPGRGLPPT